MCTGCDATGSIFCAACVASITPYNAAHCWRCGLPAATLGGVCSACRTAQSPLDETFAAAYFEGSLRRSVHAFKYQGTFAAGQPLADVMWHARPALESFDVLVPIPLHAERQAARGYNQAEVLASHLSAMSGKPMLTDGLFRMRSTRRQVGLNIGQRQRNVSQAFQADGSTVAGLRILLIDDVCTTGSTLIASAEALAAAGAHHVSAFCLAKARNPREHVYENQEEIAEPM